ncbi:hypothetical protein MR829_08170 [Paracoccus versutus]|uniref:VapE domain-containing protein n=1 Tax=Paracoccus versutus TaxID=34007 RepID=UPI001FB67B37|nr:VapE domain-containing protein [Paracoccus versutus]MCJ1900351.1 hypothetical protein [Paracoccus versutus]
MNSHVTPTVGEQILTPDIEAAKRFLAELLGPNAPVTVRLIWQKSQAVQGENTYTFTNPTKDDWAAISFLNVIGYSVFFFVNELDGTGGTSDSNVVRIRSNFVDLDNISTAEESAHRIVAEMKPSLMVQSSPGKYHAYFRFPHHQDAAHFRLTQQKLAARYGGDRSICNPARLMRLPGFLHQKGQPILVQWGAVQGGQDTTPETLAQALQDVQVAEGVNGARQPLGTLQQAPTREWLQTALDSIDPNDLGRDEWSRVYWAVMQAGWTLYSREELWQMLEAWCARYTRQWASGEGSGNDPNDNRGVWINGEHNGTSTGLPTILRAASADVRPKLEAELRRFDPYAAFAGMQFPVTVSGRTTLDFLDISTGSTAGKKISSEVYRIIKDNKLSIGFDTFKNKISVRDQLPWEKNPTRKYPRDWTDTDEDFLQAYMQQMPGMATITMNHVLSGLRMYVDRNKFNPVVDYLNGLQWDGVPRLDELFTRYFNAENVEFARLTGPKFLIGMVARAINPGCQRDEMPIFEGDQGAKKSTALNILAGDEYFSDGLPNLHDKDAMQHLQGLWLIEIGELSALRKSEVEEVKRFITTRIDKFRPSYGRNIVERPRTIVFAGTTNNENYLKDPTGARRFWPITCGRIDSDGLRRDRDQLFAEAVTRYRAGERWWLDGEAETALARDETDSRLERDDWHDDIMAFVTRWEMMGGGPVTIRLIMEQALRLQGVSLSNAGITGRISRILRAENYRKIRGVRDHTGHRTPVYIRK